VCAACRTQAAACAPKAWLAGPESPAPAQSTAGEKLAQHRPPARKADHRLCLNRSATARQPDRAICPRPIAAVVATSSAVPRARAALAYVDWCGCARTGRDRSAPVPYMQTVRMRPTTAITRAPPSSTEIAQVHGTLSPSLDAVSAQYARCSRKRCWPRGEQQRIATESAAPSNVVPLCTDPAKVNTPLHRRKAPAGTPVGRSENLRRQRPVLAVTSAAVGGTNRALIRRREPCAQGQRNRGSRAGKIVHRDQMPCHVRHRLLGHATVRIHMLAAFCAAEATPQNTSARPCAPLRRTLIVRNEILGPAASIRSSVCLPSRNAQARRSDERASLSAEPARFPLSTPAPRVLHGPQWTTQITQPMSWGRHD